MLISLNDLPEALRKQLSTLRACVKLALDVKKLDGQWRTRNIPTNLVLQFDHQRPLPLFDDLDLTHLFLGYQRDDTEITKSSIWLVCPDGSHQFRWITELSGNEASGGVEFAIGPTDPLADSDTQRIKPRKPREGELPATADGNASDDD